ncbi:hypothetical protein Syun_003329 [Stephania yunnanensis]|uniref:Pentatricopeptide repeat-containing protein n=1 Tax=Stephania yunnanensis TaxID=152371 RepID=A0AAP0PZR9_9MAGN
MALEPNDLAAYLLLSNTYATHGQWKDVLKVRKLMKQNGLKKEIEKSWIEVHNVIHEFGANDRLHTQADDIAAQTLVMVDQVATMASQASQSDTMTSTTPAHGAPEIALAGDGRCKPIWIGKDADIHHCIGMLVGSSSSEWHVGDVRERVLEGVFAHPVALPGSKFYRAKRASYYSKFWSSFVCGLLILGVCLWQRLKDLNTQKKFSD